MAQVTLPNTISAGDALDASKIQANFDALVAAINSIDSTQLGLDSVGASAIVDASVTSAKIADGSIDTDQIAAAAVTTAKIADGDVTDAKLANVVTPPIHDVEQHTISAGNTVAMNVAGLNTSKWPLWAVYWQDPSGGAGYREIGSFDSTGKSPHDYSGNGIQTSGQYNGSSFDITVTNDTGAQAVVYIVCIGEAA